MKGFEGGGEIKALCNVGSIAACNADCHPDAHYPAIMFGKSNDIVITMFA